MYRINLALTVCGEVVLDNGSVALVSSSVRLLATRIRVFSGTGTSGKASARDTADSGVWLLAKTQPLTKTPGW